MNPHPFLSDDVYRASQLWRTRNTESKEQDPNDFAATLGVDEEDLQRRLLADEFLKRWRQGELLPIELFMYEHVRFRSDEELLLALISIEMAYMEAEPSESCYCEERFPRLAYQIKELFVAYGKNRKNFHPILYTAPEEDECSAFNELETLHGPPMNETLKSIASGVEGNDNLDESEGAVDSVVLHEAYVVKDEIGHGASKLVYEAKQRSTRQTVALKTLREKHLDDEGEGSERDTFIREARTQTLFGHQSIPPVFSLGEDTRGRPFFVEKHIRGIPWSDRIKEYGLEENLRILHRVATAVGYVHQEHQVIHRDLKPANVKIDEEYSEVYVVDWGSALHVGHVEDEQHPALHVSRAKHSRATPAYMSPETAVGTSEKCTTSTDVFMLGGVLYEILTGDAPYASAIKGTGDPVLAVVQAAAVKKHPPLRDNCRYPVIAEDLFAIVDRAMEYKQEDRYPDAIAFAEALNTYRKYSEAMRSCARISRSFQEASSSDSNEFGALKRRRAMRMIEIAEQYCGIQEMLAGDESSTAYQRALNEEFAVRETLASLCLDVGDLGIATEELDRLDILLPKVQDQNDRRDNLNRLRERQERIHAVRRRLVALKWIAAALVLCLTGSMIGMAMLRNQAKDSQKRMEVAETRTKTADKLARSAQLRTSEIEREARKQVAATHAAGRFMAEAATHGRETRPQWETYYLAQSLIENDLPSTRAAISESLQHSLVVVGADCFPGIESYELARVFSVGYDPRSGLLVADGNESDSTFRIWQTNSDRENQLIPEFSEEPNAVRHAHSILVQKGGERFITTCSDGCVRIWDAQSGICLKTISMNTETLHGGEGGTENRESIFIPECPPSITVDSTGERLAIADVAQNITIWDLNQLELICRWNASGPTSRGNDGEAGSTGPCSVLFGPNGHELLSITSDGELVFWELSGETPVPLAASRWLGLSSNEAIVACPNGMLFAVASEQGLVSVWEWATRKLVRIYKVTDEKIVKSGLNLEPNNVVASAPSISTDEAESEDRQRRTVASLAFSPNSRLLLACAENGDLILFDLYEDMKLNHYTAPSIDSEEEGDASFSDAYPYADFAPSGEIIHLLSDGELHFLDYNAWPESISIVPGTSGVQQFVHSPSYDELCLIDGDLHPSRWILKTVERLPDISDEVGDIELIDYHPQGDMFFAATTLGELLLVDRATGSIERRVGNARTVFQGGDALESEISSPLSEIELSGNSSESPVTCAAVHPEGRWVVTNGPAIGAIYLWDLEECRCLRLIPIFESGTSIHTLAFHPSGAQLACGGRNGDIVFWDMDRWREQSDQYELKQFANAGAKNPLVRYSPDGRLLIQVGAGGELSIWDSASMKIASTLSETVQGRRLGERQLFDVAFSQDSKMLATCGVDGCVRLWRLDPNSSPLPLFVISTIRLACRPFLRSTSVPLQGDVAESLILEVHPLADDNPFQGRHSTNAAYQSGAVFPKSLGTAPDPTVCGVCFSSDDEQLFAAHADGGVIVYDLKRIREELEREPADIMESVQDQTGLRSSIKTIRP
jgi:WD40 repeat protein/serine/threonine protein kinase